MEALERVSGDQAAFGADISPPPYYAGDLSGKSKQSLVSTPETTLRKSYRSQSLDLADAIVNHPDAFLASPCQAGRELPKTEADPTTSPKPTSNKDAVVTKEVPNLISALINTLPWAGLLWEPLLLSFVSCAVPTQLSISAATRVIILLCVVFEGFTFIVCLANEYLSGKPGPSEAAYQSRYFGVWIQRRRMVISFHKRWRVCPLPVKIIWGFGFCALVVLRSSLMSADYLLRTVGISWFLLCAASFTPCLRALYICCQFWDHWTRNVPMALAVPVYDNPHLRLRELWGIANDAWHSYGLPGHRLNLSHLLQECESRVSFLGVGCTHSRKIESRRLKALREFEVLLREYGAEDFCSDPFKYFFTPAAASEHLHAVAQRTFVVMVAINSYDDNELGLLEGPVSDADDFKKYFVDYLGVPEAHIVSLKNGEATREGILDALYSHLRDNDRIRRDDNLIFWFAGHGISYSTKCLSSVKGFVGSICALCPVDRGLMLGGGGLVPDISSRELNMFLRELNNEKGGHITVILDCCFAGGAAGGTISISNELPIEDGLIAMLEAADNDSRRRDVRKANSESWEPDMTTHVLLAASREWQPAFEFKDRRIGRTSGLFSTALLRLLQSQEGQTMTYQSALDLMGPLGHVECRQTPVAKGSGIDCQIWFTDHIP